MKKLKEEEGAVVLSLVPVLIKKVVVVQQLMGEGAVAQMMTAH